MSSSGSGPLLIGQANVAGKQVVQNIQRREVHQGNGNQTSIEQQKPAVDGEIAPGNTERTEISAGQHLANPTMGEKQ
jgi:hypothetical protein